MRKKVIIIIQEIDSRTLFVHVFVAVASLLSHLPEQKKKQQKT